MRIFIYIIASIALWSVSSLAGVQKELPAVKVETLICAPQSVSFTFKYPAIVASQIDGKLISEIDGLVTDIRKRIGEKVRRGEIIFYVKNNQFGLNYNKYAVRAPVSGILSILGVSVGQSIEAGKAAGEITDPLKLKLIVEVPAQDIDKLRVGLRGEFIFGESKIQASISALSPVVNPSTGTARMELEPQKDREQKGLRAGLIGQLTLYLPETKTILLPTNALIILYGKYFVRVVDAENKVLLREVVIGGLVEGKQAILSGLDEKDEVIIRASDFVKEGDKIERMQKESASS